MYKNTELKTVTVEGNTKADRAIQAWNSMNPMQRIEIMAKVKPFKNLALRERACINFIYDSMEAA